MTKCLHIFISVFVFFIVHNDTNKQRNCFLYWVDHPYEFRQSINIHGGEYDAGESFRLSQEYNPGLYQVKWTLPRQGETFRYLFVAHEQEEITLTPSGVKP